MGRVASASDESQNRSRQPVDQEAMFCSGGGCGGNRWTGSTRPTEREKRGATFSFNPPRGATGRTPSVP